MIRLGIIATLLLILFSSLSINVYAHPGHLEHDGIAQAESEEPLSDEESTESAQMEVEQNVQYELAYPGMLPDNPLYFLKTMRDAVVRFLISDSLKKAEFNLLTSDKRIYAAQLLADNDKSELALETLLKSNNYMHEAVVSLSKAKEEDKNINPILSNLKTSVKKHREVVSRQIAPNMPENMSDMINRELDRLEDIEKSADNLAS